MAVGRWTREQAWEWYHRQPWICGFNFLPSTAVNSTEMWQQDSFDENTIDRELGWASHYGYNSCRVFLQYLVWNADAEGYRKRIERFLDIADGHGISTMPVLFDDCAFAEKEPYLGRQDDPVPGVHNSGWTPSPGPAIADDESMQSDLRSYVQGILGSFLHDSRIVAWDLYNEAGNSGRDAKSLKLLADSFRWAREDGPCQPLTSGVWACEATEQTCLDLSDIITFHCYKALEATRARIDELKARGRPVINTEWMARTFGCTIRTHLPLYKDLGIGCYQWGLVQGKIQTHFPWGSPVGAPELDLWFHDVLKQDGTPYNPEEMALVREICSQAREQ